MSRRSLVLLCLGGLLLVGLMTGLAALLSDYTWLSTQTLFYFLTFTSTMVAGVLVSRASRRQEQQSKGK